ncbi:MAG: ParB/RepB/Spo0J family partition protein [Deltaproteobacteria bacterium]|nr:ParB/RepB/Spo0J family partition protein [Deltaproteobacteria bacterium]
MAQGPSPGIVGVKTIPTNELEPNPHNPRRLFDPEPLKTLKGSIAKVGILVPLTVYWAKSRKTWVILDGQRRWICAQELGIKSVPANEVAEPSIVQNIVTMFQIHKLRADWELMPTALTLEVLMIALQERRDDKLAELTGLDRAVVTRCKKLLSFSKKYQDMMLDPEPEKRAKADFFIELYPVLHDRTVRRMAWFRPDTFTTKMLRRYNEGGLNAVTDFRKIKQHINTAVRAGKQKIITQRLEEFTQESDLPIEHLAIQSASLTSKVREITLLPRNWRRCFATSTRWTSMQKMICGFVLRN